MKIPVRMGQILTKIKNKKPATTRDPPASDAAATPAPAVEPAIATPAAATSAETIDSASTNSDAMAWTAAQDGALVGMKQLGRTWKEINEAFADKTIGELKQRYKDINIGTKEQGKGKKEGGIATSGSMKGKGKAKSGMKKAKITGIVDIESDASSDEEDTGTRSSKTKGKGKAKASKKKVKVEEPVYSESDESSEEASEEEAPIRGILKKGKAPIKSAMKKPIVIEEADTESDDASEEEDEEEYEEEDEEEDDQSSKKGEGKAAKKVTFEEPEDDDSDGSYIDPGYDFLSEFDAPEGYELPASGRAKIIEVEDGEQSPYQLRGRPIFYVQPEDHLTQDHVSSVLVRLDDR